MARKFKTATAAGTFDSFHKGHEKFLLAAFDAADTIYIAITSDVFAKQSRPHEEVLPFNDRRKYVEEFLEKHNLLSRSKFIELHDIYGPTLEPDCPIEAIIVTEKTRYGAELINKLRTKKGLPPLAVEEVAYIKASDGGDLSSSRIRAGEIDREGDLWIKRDWLKRTLTLPDAIRPMLQRPIGELIEGSEEDLSKAVEVIKQRIAQVHPWGVSSLTPQGWKPKIVTVGDVVAKSFNEGGLAMDIAIVDYHVKRAETFKNLSEIGFRKKEPDAVAENPKGTLTGEIFQAVQNAFSRHPELVSGSHEMPKQVRHDIGEPYVIRVIGEEDLATLAAVLAAPLDTHVFYGQPPYHSVRGKQIEGIVQVVVTEDKKAEVRDIVSKFSYP